MKDNTCWQGCEKIGILVQCWWECKLVKSLWKTVWWLLKKLKIDLPCESAITLLNVHPEELKAGSQRNMCTPALFHNSPKVRATHAWIRRMSKQTGHMHATECSSAS